MTATNNRKTRTKYVIRRKPEAPAYDEDLEQIKLWQPISSSTINTTALIYPATVTSSTSVTTYPRKTVTWAPMGITQKKLDLKDEWTTEECAWYCGVSKSTWHVYMGKNDGLAPVHIGVGAGRQSRWLADDVRRYKRERDKKKEARRKK